jgi:hypothetical protein
MSPFFRFAVGVSSLLLLGAGGAVAQVVVLSAHGPSAVAYPQGAILRADKIISLKAGDSLELLDAAGSRVVKGPASIVAGQPAGGSRATLVDIFAKGQHAHPGIAATRGFTLQPVSAPGDDGNLWRVDVTEGGDACVLAGQKPSFARGDSSAPAPVSISRTSTGDKRIITWTKGGMTADWPSGLPVTDGESYKVTFEDGSSATLVWRTLPASTAGVEPLAADLLDKGCYAQLDRLRAASGFADPAS